MNDKERLIEWMRTNHITAAQLARATGDAASAISYMTSGDREINQAFKWRFAEAFGFDIAQKVFPKKAQEQTVTVLEHA